MIIQTTKKSKKIIETIKHETDLGVTLTETIVNKKHTGITLTGKDKELYPVFFDDKKAFLKKSINKFLDPHYGFIEFIKDYQKSISSIEEINLYPTYFAFYSGWILFNQEMVPMSLPLPFGYIGSLREKRRDDPLYKELIAKLKKHPFILSLEEEEIPYYNTRFCGQKGISLALAYLPQEKYVELYDQFKGKQFWSVSMHDAIKMSYDKGVNVYGDEIQNLLKEYWASEEIEE